MTATMMTYRRRKSDRRNSEAEINRKGWFRPSKIHKSKTNSSTKLSKQLVRLWKTDPSPPKNYYNLLLIPWKNLSPNTKLSPPSMMASSKSPNSSTSFRIRAMVRELTSSPTIFKLTITRKEQGKGRAVSSFWTRYSVRTTAQYRWEEWRWSRGRRYRWVAGSCTCTFSHKTNHTFQQLTKI